MSPPPLPTIPRLRNGHVQIRDFMLLEMQEYAKSYGQQCREAALEEAAQVCSHKAETKRLYLNEAHYLECAEAIRGLKS